MPALYVLQHLAAEPPALIRTVLEAEGFPVEVVRVDQQGLPARPAEGFLPEALGLVVMGGPMAVYQPERAPWIPAELAHLRAALEADLPVLGVCLGAQLLAAAAGARVVPGGRPKEIGWGEIRLTPAGRADPLCAPLLEEGRRGAATVFQWHGDTFDLPPGAGLLAGSALYPHQAFRLGGRAYGFQFHFEVTAPIIQDWAARWPDELAGCGLTAADLLAGPPARLEGLQRRGSALIRAFGALLRASARARTMAAAVPR